MFGILARLLELLYSFWPSYAGSIVLFTIAIMLVLAPLTFKSTRSKLAMQALQPEMKKLQNRYKDDRQKLNEEMMKFYQENKISPLGGCLPMLVQLPVFFILYEVLLNLTRRGPYGADLGTAAACHIQNGAACVNNVFTHAGYFHPSYLKTSSDLFRDLSHTRTMDSWGLDLSQSALNALKGGLGHALPYLVMVVVVVGLTYLQQQQLQSRQPKNADVNPTQQLTMKIMPVVMGVIYIVIPAGVVVYFLVSSLFRIGQQAMVTRTFYSGPNAIVIPATATEPGVGDDAPPKKFWDQFKPSQEALPRVGKRAEQRGGSTSSKSSSSASSAKGGSNKGGSKSGSGQNGSGTKKRPAGAASASAKSPAKSGAKSTNKPVAKPGPKNGSKAKQRPDDAAKATPIETTASAPAEEAVAPSRRAPAASPSRRAPGKPGGGKGKRSPQ
jgi:YidC/Oxa1 family membrane protein insertase